MQIVIGNNHLHITDEQKEYIEEKVTHLKHLWQRVDDESTMVRVEVELNKIKTSNKNISLSVTMHIPKHILRAEVDGVTVEEAIDLAVDKLKKQVERSKQHDLEKRPK